MRSEQSEAAGEGSDVPPASSALAQRAGLALPRRALRLGEIFVGPRYFELCAA
jgi:hypothetical protein